MIKVGSRIVCARSRIYFDALAIEMDVIKDRYCRNYPELRLYLELSTEEYRTPDGQTSYFPPRDDSNPHRPLLIFLKSYDPLTGEIKYAGNLTVKSKHLKIQDIIPTILERMKWNPETQLKLFEEVKPDMIDPLTRIKNTFEASELSDGDIICFQKELTEQELSALPANAHVTVKDYFEFLQNRVVVMFKPKELDPRLPEEQNQEFDLELAKKMSYDTVAERVAQRLGADPLKLRFWAQHTPTSAQKMVVRRSQSGTLSQMLFGSHAQASSTLFYEILDITVAELEQKRSMKVTFLEPGLKEHLVPDLLVPKTATVGEFLELLKPKVKLAENGSGRLRLYEVAYSKIMREFSNEDLVKDITDLATLYAEEIDCDEQPGDRTVKVVHFSKEPTRFHSIPFRFRLIEVGVRTWCLELYVPDRRKNRGKCLQTQRNDCWYEWARKRRILRR